MIGVTGYFRRACAHPGLIALPVVAGTRVVNVSGLAENNQIKYNC